VIANALNALQIRFLDSAFAKSRLPHHKMYCVAAYSLSRFFHLFFHLFLLANEPTGRSCAIK
jgi:hypothetical protein